MPAAVSCPKAHFFTACPAAGRRAAKPARLTVSNMMADYDPREEYDARQIIGGEWSPTISWSLPTTAVHNNSQKTTMAAHVPAAEEGADATDLMSGNWDARSCSLASYDDVMDHFYAMKHPKKK